jgi:hypothetical protein
MSTLTMEAAAFLPSQDQAEFFLQKAGHYRKLAADAHCGSVSEALEAVARDFAQRALAAQNRK